MPFEPNHLPNPLRLPWERRCTRRKPQRFDLVSTWLSCQMMLASNSYLQLGPMNSCGPVAMHSHRNQICFCSLLNLLGYARQLCADLAEVMEPMYSLYI
jgi:hypothetical protein